MNYLSIKNALKLNDTYQPYQFHKTFMDLSEKFQNRLMECGEYIDENSSYTVFENYLFFRGNLKSGWLEYSFEISVGELPDEYTENDISELVSCIEFEGLEVHFNFN